MTIRQIKLFNDLALLANAAAVAWLVFQIAMSYPFAVSTGLALFVCGLTISVRGNLHGPTDKSGED